jgi:hypothetical protein
MNAAPVDLRALLEDEPRTRHLLDNPRLMLRLDALVGALSPGGEWKRLRDDLGPISWPKVAAQGRALGRALEDVERLMCEEPMATILKWADGHAPARGLRALVWNPKVRAVGGFGPWLEALGEIRSIAHGCTLGEGEWKRERGRPSDPWRDRFCVEIAEALGEAGEKVSKSRDGAFACVLTFALIVAEGKAPEDVFPLVRRAVDAIAAKTR